MKQVYKDNLTIQWKHFSLEQNAYKIKTSKSNQTPESLSWKVWNQEDPTGCRSLVAAIVSESVRKQGPEIFDKFHLALLTARHNDPRRVSLQNYQEIFAVANEVGVDLDRLKSDVTDDSIRGIIGKEHEYADSLGIFGTPTFVFEDGEVVFLKTFTPAAEDSVAEFEHFLGVSRRSNIGEIKRPQPPWPKGVMD